MMRILRIFENIGAANHVAVMYKAHSAIIIKMCFDLREVLVQFCTRGQQPKVQEGTIGLTAFGTKINPGPPALSTKMYPRLVALST